MARLFIDEMLLNVCTDEQNGEQFYLDDREDADDKVLGFEETNIFEIIGLNAATHWRRFKFPDNTQLEWLMFHLLESKAKRHIILCHAPLRLHHP